jgi:hypothetical protein
LTKSDEFRERAGECVKLAAAATDEKARAALMHMADAWVRLAEGREKLLLLTGHEER